MDIADKYNPEEVEKKWYAYWTEHKCFSSTPDGRKPYTVVIPPPNVTGVLHMGHVLNETIQDILVRRARMEGKNACWVPGTDHASIATEAKVVARLADRGIKKSDLTREQFLEHAWEWTREHGGIILSQLRSLGASCDWDRTAFTMDDVRSKSVIHVFVDLYRKGLIYRGVRMVNWDPKALTALSDEEVVYKEEHTKLYYMKYRVAEDDGTGATGEEGEVIHSDAEGRYAVVATTRPETVMGDVAVCINPNDPKNHWLRGKRLIVPLVGRVVPVIEDEYVDIEFGTGCLKVTPAHDVNDYALGEKYHLPSIDIFNDDATISEAAGMYVGQDRFDVRKQIAEDMVKAGLMEKIEDYDNKIGCSERTGVPIEPKLSTQWFLRMQHFADLALAPVMNDEIEFHPAKYKNTYRHWLENIKDWCISRQLWWGHRIPAYYLPDGTYVVAETEEEALELARQKDASLTAADLRRDEDALDTWFSSWLWPMSLFDGIRHPEGEEFAYYYPTDTLVTGPDIIFFWVARMIMAGYEYTGKRPFKHVYFTGIVRDKLGRKMSKSLGNSPDPLDLIARYSADGVRMGMMLAAPAGNDILFDEALCLQGRNFCNKIWNAFRLVNGWEASDKVERPAAAAQASAWFDARLRTAAANQADLFSKFRLSEALMDIFLLFRDDFSGWYLEAIKPAAGQPLDAATYSDVLRFFDHLLHLLHPFMPFITEELWQNLAERTEGESLMCSAGTIAAPEEGDEATIKCFADVQQIVQNIRGIRAAKQISPREPLSVAVGGELPVHRFADIVCKMANVTIATNAAEAADATSHFMVGTTEYRVNLEGHVDTEAELAKAQAEIERLKKFLEGIEKKLSNERFVSHAPEAVVAMERKKQADATTKIQLLEETVAKLTNR